MFRFSILRPVAITAALGCLAYIVLATPAHAQANRAAVPDSETHAVAVRYGDLDLGREPRAKLTISRLEMAADAACGGRPAARRLADLFEFGRCRAESLDQAVRTLHAPLVARIARNTTRQGLPDDR